MTMITNFAFAVVATALALVAETPVTSVAQKVAELVAEDPNVDSSMFHETFLKAVPPQQLVKLTKQFHEEHGKVVGVSKLSVDSPIGGRFLFTYSDGSIMDVLLDLDDAVSRRIIGLRFLGTRPGLESWDDLRSEFEKLPGEAGFRVLRITDDSPAEYDASKEKESSSQVIAEFNAQKSLAVGSAFKLYILAELVEQGQPWDKVVPLNPDWFSIPSGVMQTWPAHSPVTLHTLALQMISISDNTATDHLLMHLGRDAVWQRMRLSNAEPERSRPFLRTIEMFKLKDHPELLQRYVAAGVAERMKILEKEVAAIPRDKVRGAFTPTAIDTVEWFASAADLCRMMTYFHRKNDPHALEILAVNPGVHLPKSDFPYVGYKGGSEPGVINVTWLLRDAKGNAYAVAGSWNNPKEAVDEDQFVGLMNSALHLLRNER